MATEGPDGSIVLSAAAEDDTQQVPMVEDSEQIVEVEVLENQFQVIKNSTNEILNEVNYEMETVILTLSYDVLDKNSLASGQPVNIEVRLEREDEVF